MRFLKRLCFQLTVRWRAFMREADATRRSSAEISSAIQAHRVGGDAAAAVIERLEWPLRGRVTSPFGMRHGRMHEGIDIALSRGAPVHPAGDGEVLIAGDLESYGKVVVIVHDASLATVYAHLDGMDVAVGDKATPRRRLGILGSTGRSFGPCLHFEVRFEGTAVDPGVYLERSNATEGDAQRVVPRRRQ
jgi:murein DD-endopeptidase MepM/ murein hydrolase activator NlpD